MGKERSELIMSQAFHLQANIVIAICSHHKIKKKVKEAVLMNMESQSTLCNLFIR